MTSSLLFLALCLVACGSAHAQCSNTSPCPFKGGDDFITPEETSSVDGKLDMTLTVDVSDVTVEWLTLTRRTYNGGWPSPTLRVRAGDSVDVLLKNDLGENQAEGEPNTFRHPNTTNLHVHGLHISPREPQDDVLIQVNPGSEHQYRYELNELQPAGTYWYHAHHHGATYFQVASGLAGLLIVEDEENSMSDELAAISCPKHCDKEVPMLLGKMLFYGRDFFSFPAIQDQIGDIFLLDDIVTDENITLLDWLETHDATQYLTNGQYVPKVSLQPGEIRRFRLVNVGPTDMLEIYLEGCEMVVLAFDGIYVDEPYETNYVFIPDAGRADVAVRCAEAGSYQLISQNAPDQIMSIGNTPVYDGILATIEVSGEPVEMSFPTSLPERPFFNLDLRGYPDTRIRGRNVVEFGPTPYLNREKMKTGDYFRYKFRTGTVQEWYLVNSDPSSGHPYHVHVNHFQVVAYNQYNGPVASFAPAYYDQQGFLCDQQLEDFDPLEAPEVIPVNLTFLGHETRDRGMAGYVPIGQWRDTIMVPPLASITIRFMADEYPGTCVIHCHFLNHEDVGMMMVTEIVRPWQSIRGAHVTSGGFYPGTCKFFDEWPDVRKNSPSGSR
ncbi:multicopper oxidase CueO-like [Branchiostoma floridae x Branchiostoma japonicum]